MRNCELIAPSSGIVDWFGAAQKKIDLENCLVFNPAMDPIGVHYQPSVQEPIKISVRLHRSTLLCGGIIWFACHEKKDTPGEVWLHIEATANLFDGTRTVLDVTDFRRDRKPLTRTAAETYLSQSLSWRGRENVYPDRLTTWMVWPGTRPGGEPGKDTAAWDKFWTTAERGSSKGRIRYVGGDVWSKATTAPESISPDDFRLRSDSAGYRAGKDGKDLGADVDLVGPGPAYERWKKKPAYQQWRKETGQIVSATDDAAKRELAKWQGEWENSDYGRLIIKGDRWSWHPKEGPEVVSTIEIVEVTDKMTHVLLLNTGLDAKVRTIQTILRVDGDTLHNCGTIGSIRPTAFANEPGYLYVQWKRVAKTPP